MTTVDLVDFLVARIAEDEAPTWDLIPYECEPGCCAPASYVGHRCLICGTDEFGGTVAAVSALSAEHDERIHRRSRVLAECAAKRRIVELCTYETTERVEVRRGVYEQRPVRLPNDWADVDDDVSPDVLRALALPYADHPDYQQEWAP